MSQSVVNPRERVTMLLTDAFETLTDSNDDSGNDTFYVNYRGDGDVGRWIVGRNEKDSGLDYVYRQRFNAADNEPDRVYLYTSEHGWEDTNILLAERDIIIGLFEWVERDTRWYENVKNGELTTDIDEAFDELNDYMQSTRQMVSLDDIVDAIHRRDFHYLQNRVAPDGDSAAEFWKLLVSYDPNGEPIDNEVVTIPYCDDTLMLARGERQYTSNGETKEYPIGLVIGIDDTPDKFFVHRIERDDKLDDADSSWSLSDIRQRMGFNVDYTDLPNNKIPTDKVTRLQGNLSVVPCHFETEKREYYNELISSMKEYLHRMYGDLYSDTVGLDISEDVEKYLLQRQGAGRLAIGTDTSTERLKTIQDMLHIDEEDVRSEQERRGIQRLSANLRREIIEDLYHQSFCDWLFTESTVVDIEEYRNYRSDSFVFSEAMTQRRVENDIAGEKLFQMIDITRSSVHQIAEDVVEEEFTADAQENLVLGNHSVLANPATEHPSSNAVDWRDRNALEKLIVPEKSLVILGHDEHNSRVYTFPKGVYLFRFLDGLDTGIFS